MRAIGIIPVVSLTLALTVFPACSDDERVEIRTGDGVSDSRGGDGAFSRATFPLTNREGDSVTTTLELELLGVVDSPEVDGMTLQATDVRWHGDVVLASYNVRGEEFLGALQVIDVSEPAEPQVLAEAVYSQTDLSNVRMAGDRIFAAGADEELGATLEAFRLSDGLLSFEGHTELGSFAGTYVELHGGQALVTYGDQGGGVAIFDVGGPEPELLTNMAVEDARWVSPWPDDGLIAVAGSPGRILRYGEATAEVPALADSAGVTGASIGAPTWAQRREDLLFLSSDDAGLLVYDLRDMTLVGELNTEGTANGSALSVDGRLAFLANGEEGLVVADVLDPTNPVELARIDMVDDNGSANAVALGAETLALADGLGGIKLIAFHRTVETVDGDCDGDGTPDSEDADDDDDGVLDDEDQDACNPDVVCTVEDIHHVGRFVGEFYNLPCDHPDVEGRVTGVVEGTLPWDFDWWDEQYYTFTIERDDLTIDYSENYFPVDQGECGDPFYFSAYWTTTAIATEEGTYRFEMASDDDGWLFIDGELVIDLGGVHGLRPDDADVFLSAGPHRIEVWFAERHRVQSGLHLEVTEYPSEEARLELIQHLCLDPEGDEDGDGEPNATDVAPLTRPDED